MFSTFRFQKHYRLVVSPKPASMGRAKSGKMPIFERKRALQDRKKGICDPKTSNFNQKGVQNAHLANPFWGH